LSAGKRTRLEAINALAELDRIGWKYKPLSETEVRIKCPAHDDGTPSASLNVEKREWKCHASQCGAAGDIVSLCALAMGVERGTMLVDMGQRYDIDDVKSIDPRVVEKFASRLHEAGPLLKALRDRGLTDEMMAAARLGYHEGRITIPVFDEASRVVNIRRYLPGAPGNLKMQNTPGYGKPSVYRVKELVKHKRVWLCGGEMKAIVAGWMLDQKPELDCGAISITAGEGTWDHAWDALLADREVFVCMDVDDPGRKAAKRLAAGLSRVARAVHIIRLPLDVAKHPKGDINDWVATEGAGPEQFALVMKSADAYKIDDDDAASKPDAPIERVELRRATDAENLHRRIETEAVVTALETTPYLVPRVVRVMCTRDQPNCTSCPVMTTEPNADDGFTECEVPDTSAACLELVDSPRSQQRVAIRDALRIPPCKVVEFVPRTHHICRALQLAPQLTMRSEGGNNVSQPSVIVNAEVDLNVPYVFRGRLHSHPKTHQATLVFNGAAETQDSLSSFDPTDEQLAELKAFEPTEWSLDGVQAKLDHLYDDLEHNVTGIYGRRLLHVMIDFAYFSVIGITFEGRLVNGWTNVLIIGDSAQGKTEATTRAMEHYGLGERTECKNATVAGMLGGLQQIGKRWYVSWGVIPTHDRRLVILEEVKGAPVEVIARLTDMRSSGIAEIPKIERRRCHARTRLIFVSNPRSNRSMSRYNYGVEAIQELIGGLEDVRRFDVAMVLASGMVTSDVIQKETGRSVAHTYTADLNRRLVMWTWTRKPEDVKLEHGVQRAIATEGDSLCDQFTESLPLIDRGTVKLKLLRLAAALAARTHSVGEHPRQLLVRECHVAAASYWLRTAYDDPAMGYGEYTKAVQRVTTVADRGKVMRYLSGTRHPKALIDQLLHRDEIHLQDLQDLCELDRDAAQRALSFLVITHCIVRDGRVGYRKTSDFIDMLRAAKDVASPNGVAQPREEPF
jgi:hypothetical protein